MKNKRLSEKQRDLLSKTIVDIGKLIFAALVLAQILSDKPLNKVLFLMELLFLTGSVVIGVSIAENKTFKKEK